MEMIAQFKYFCYNKLLYVDYRGIFMRKMSFLLAVVMALSAFHSCMGVQAAALTTPESSYIVLDDDTRANWSLQQDLYVDLNGNPTMDAAFNPNGSLFAIEGITSPDGRVLGKMGHSERIGKDLYRNVPGEYDIRMFEAAVKYFK